MTPWPGPPRLSSKSASASRSTAICRPNSDLATRFPPKWDLTAIVLGAAAGGGFPQWNCSCDVCRLAWAGDPRVRSRTQASLAVSADGEHWTLLNASPDLRAQIRRQPALHPRGNARQPDRRGGADRRRDRPDRRPAEPARALAVHAHGHGGDARGGRRTIRCSTRWRADVVTRRAIAPGERFALGRRLAGRAVHGARQGAALSRRRRIRTPRSESAANVGVEISDGDTRLAFRAGRGGGDAGAARAAVARRRRCCSTARCSPTTR